MFKGSVHRTTKCCRSELNQMMDQSIFQLQLPKFVAILVASCLISKIFQNHPKTGCNELQLVKWSCELHTLATMFITFNLILGS